MTLKTSLGGLSLDSNLKGQYHRLLRNLGLLVLLLVALATSTVVWFDERLVADLSGKLIDNTSDVMKNELVSFWETAESNLRIAIEQLQMTDEQDEDLMKVLFARLSPFLNQHEVGSGIIIADVERGAEYLILKPDPTRPEFLVRILDPEQWGEKKLRFERWEHGEMQEGWFRRIDYDITSRPWYRNAMDAPELQVVGTQPYQFFTLEKPGTTLSARWKKRDSGREYITAYDIVLSNISRFTQSMRPTENGMVFVFTKDARIVGLPAHERFHDAQAVDAALLEAIEDLDIPPVQNAVDQWEQRGRTWETFRFEVDGQNWWAGFEYEESVPEQERFYAGIIVPESDFLGALAWQRNIALAGIVVVGILVALALILHAVRVMRRDLREAVSRIGQKLGPFELLYKIGDGGNGSVYRARHALLRRPTAVKVMRPEFSSSETAKQRFEHEVQITSSLTHPNTVAVYDFGQTPEGTLYYAMEYLDGVSLEDLVRISGPQSPERVLHVLHQVCGSLAEAHARGLIHRDIKPSNIMLCERGGLQDVTKVLDFGLVKDIQGASPDLTQANTLVGTPLYMAPELIADATGYSPASDLYALGAVGYFLLTGRNVFEGTSAVEICARHLHDEPVSPSKLARQPIPADLESLILSCLSKDVASRPASAVTFAGALAGCSGFGGWTWEMAQAWWADHGDELPLDDRRQDHEPLADTHLLVDQEHRIRGSGAT